LKRENYKNPCLFIGIKGRGAKLKPLIRTASFMIGWFFSIVKKRGR